MTCLHAGEELDDGEFQLPDEELTAEGAQEAAGERSLAGTKWAGGSRKALPSLLSQSFSEPGG